MMTSDPQLIKNILIKDFNIFRNTRPALLTPSDHPIYRYVIDNTGDDCWLRMRSVIRTLFTDQKLRAMAKNIDNNLVDLTNALDRLLVDQSTTGVDIRQLFVNQSIDLMGSVMFSWKPNSFNEPNNKITRLMKRLFFPSKWRILANLVLPKFMLQVLNMSNIISTEALDVFAKLTVDEYSKRQTSVSTDTYEDFFQSLLNRCPEFMGESSDNKTVGQSEMSKIDQMMSKDEVVANMFSLFQGGFDGHSLSMTFIIYELAINPECQQKVYEEIMTCYRDRDSDNSSNNRTTIDGQLFDWESLVKLDYLDACISEAMRLHAAVNRDGRVANQDYTDATTGVTIEKDQVIQFSRSAVQRSADYYPMPDQFIPDRFLKHNRHQLIDSAYLPFGLGRRMCPGYRFGLMAIKLTMAHLLMRYKFLKLNNNQTVFKTNPIVEHYTYCPEMLLLKIEKRTVN
ncbi:cytochrome P450 9c1-like [Oppia nitens]|uniref:cytochrome P450 9c1-like n=1 Tax=Oppia nitens TaxID=1686743 RepID=UPI0023DCBB48|nr:cytochrome P450 9c1-like [Oppia nitens]